TLTVRQATPTPQISISAGLPPRRLIAVHRGGRQASKTFADPLKRKDFINSLLTAADPPPDTSENWG
ncbi:MAG: hypothetical protein ABJ208_10195, partial [Rhodopirellula bahusiensis]